MASDFQAGNTPPPEDGGPSVWLVFKGNKILVDPDNRPPRASGPGELGLELDATHYLGLWQGRPAYTARAPEEAPEPEGLAWHGLYGLFLGWPQDLFGLGARAKQILAWEQGNAFCGACGAAMDEVAEERARRCPACDYLAYPRISPAVIMAVQKDDKLLLARSPRFPAGRMSVLAGFVEAGETLEECVAREIREEVGVEVTDITYFGSQPWPFPDSLMIGFICQWAGGEIEIDGREIVEADWYGPDDLPAIPPSSTIARGLINQVLGVEKLPKGTPWNPEKHKLRAPDER